MILRRKLLRDMRRRRGQFAAVVLTIFLGIVLFGASYDAFLNLKASYQSLFDDLRFAHVTTVGGDTQAIADEVAARPEVVAVTTRTVADIPFRLGGNHKLLGRVVGLPAGSQPEVDQVMVLRGTYLDPARPEGVLVEQHMSNRFGLEPGSSFEVLGPQGWTQVRVAGVVASPEYIWPARSRQDILTSTDDFGVVFAGAGLFETLPNTAAHREVLAFFRPGSDGTASEAVVRDIALRHEAVDVYTRAEQPSNAALQEDVQGFGDLSLMFPLLFLGAAGMATYVLLTRMVYSQRAQIGLLLANGFRRRTVFRHYLAYGLAAGLAGAVPAVVAGALLARIITGFYTAAISVPVTVVRLHPETLLAGVLFGLVAGAVSALSPALLASRTTPAEAMRGSKPPGRAGRSILEIMVPPLRRLPTRWKMVLRGVGRNRRRSLSTVIGVVLAVTLILASWGMVDTVQILLHKQFDQVRRQDADLYFTASAGPELMGKVERVPGVAAVETTAQLPATLRADGQIYDTALVAFRPGTAMHGFPLLDGGWTDVPSQGILVGRGVRDRLGLRVGDTVRVTVSATGQSFDESIVTFLDEPLGTYAYIALPVLQDRLGPAAGTVIGTQAMLRFEPRVDREAMRARFTDMSEVAAYTDARSLVRMAESLMGLFYAFVGVMLAFGAIMAFALVFNTMSANISERSVEIATLEAAGLPRRTLSAMVTVENVLLTLLGLVPGLAVGYAASWFFMASYSSDMFRFDLHMRSTTLVATGLGLLAISLISQRPALKAVRRLDVAQVVRERSL